MDSIKPINIMVKFTAPEDRIVNEPSGVTDGVIVLEILPTKFAVSIVSVAKRTATVLIKLTLIKW